MIDYPWNNVLLLIAIEIKKGIPKILGRRKEDSKWANYLRYTVGWCTVIYAIDMFVKSLQQEAGSLQQLGGLS